MNIQTDASQFVLGRCVARVADALEPSSRVLALPVPAQAWYQRAFVHVNSIDYPETVRTQLVELLRPCSRARLASIPCHEQKNIKKSQQRIMGTVHTSFILDHLTNQSSNLSEPFDYIYLTNNTQSLTTVI